MKLRPSFLLTIISASFIAACGGSNSVPPLPPPVGMYSNASLNGQYAFSMSGESPSSLGGNPISRIGSFVADGNGAITSAIEDVNTLSSTAISNPVNFGTGTYTINADGRGSITLGTGNTALALDLTLTSTTQGLLIQIDGNATSSGSLIKSDATTFSAGSFTGNYVFDVSGSSVSSGGNVLPISIIGRVTADGVNKITAGILDENDGNQSAPSGPSNSGVTGTFQMDSQFGANFGRGSFSVTYTAYGAPITRSFAFYLVDGTRVKWLEEDSLAITQGDAIKQSGTIATNNAGFTGSFAYIVSGADHNFAPFAQVARFTADGAGSLTKIALDDNDDGSHHSITASSSTNAATYAIDTANAGSGRGAFTFNDSNLGLYTAIFYLISPTQAVVQDTSRNAITDGTMLAQTAGPFTTANLAGNYAFNWSGTIRPTTSFSSFEEDFLGQYKLTNSGIVTGAIDYVELAFFNNPISFDIPLAGTLTVNGDGTASNNFQYLIRSGQPATLDFAAYVVDANTTFVLCTDSNRVTVGSAIMQH